MKTATYKLSEDGKAITCLLCNMTSHNPDDVAQLYCGNCHAFHGGIGIWVIYERPSDCPNEYVARLHVAGRGSSQPTSVVHSAPSLEEIRRQLPAGLHRLPRFPLDEAHIVECWI